MTVTEKAPEMLFDKYEVLERLGTTGLATVYKVKDLQGKIVALKVPLGYFGRDPQLTQRYTAAVTRAQNLHHPNIVSVYGVEQQETATVTVMEYVFWPSLKSRKSPILPLGEIVSIIHQVAAALDYAHGQGTVHRDIRPSNVFYDAASGQVKVSDFGTVALVEGGHALVRSTVNTPHPSYASPEATQGQAPDPRDDVYSLGALAYELMTGEIPFDALNPHTVLTRQLTTNPIPPSEFEPWLPPAVDTVVLKALSRRMDLRYATCGELAQALEAAVGQAVAAPARGQAMGGVATPAIPAPAEQVAPEGARVMCPFCGSGNPASAQRCTNCWMILRDRTTVTVEEEEQWTKRYLDKLRKQSLRVKLTMASAVVVLLALWVYNYFDIRFPTPRPASAFASTSAEGQWTMIGRDIFHTSAVAGPAFVPEEGARWTFASNGPMHASPAVDAQHVYAATNDGRVVALDRDSGAEVWTYLVGAPINASLAKAGNLVYVGLRDGNILALNEATGKEEWKFATQGAVYSSFAIADGVLYAASTDGHFYSLDAQKGALRWKRGLDEWVLGTPSVVNGVVVFGTLNGELYMLEASTGRLRNQVGFRFAIDNSPMIIGNTAYVVTRAGRVVAYHYEQKARPFQKATWAVWLNFYFWNMAPFPAPFPGTVWDVRLKNELIYADMATDGKHIFVATYDGNLYALDAKSGKQAWKVKGVGRLQASPIVSGDTVILPASPGQLVGFDVATGEERWRHEVEGNFTASAVLAGGTLYLPTEEGYLYAIR
ncbi:MAG: PQQ-binding-like beta-propeller repeat protein [Chloroflexi bacterium]|nr:PQQ-binding-like beta-propeller repeat protein [Chloroflexota bacterium]